MILAAAVNLTDSERGSARDGRREAAQLVRDQAAGFAAVPLQQFAKESDSGASIPSGLHQDVDLVPIFVDRPPQVPLPALNPDEQFIQMPGVALPTTVSGPRSS